MHDRQHQFHNISYTSLNQRQHTHNHLEQRHQSLHQQLAPGTRADLTNNENELEFIRLQMDALRQEIFQLGIQNRRLRENVALSQSQAEYSNQIEILASRRLLETFSGDPKQNFDDWLFNLERYFIKAHIMNQEKANFALDYLKRNARQIFMSVPDHLHAPWSTHVKNLKAHYNADSKQDLLRNQLEKLKQDTNIIDHIYKFDTIVNQISNITEYDKIRHFLNSLIIQTQSNVKAQMPTTLLKAKEIAIKIDEFESVQGKHDYRRTPDEKEEEEDDESQHTYPFDQQQPYNHFEDDSNLT